MNNSLNKKITFLSLLKYTFPTILMMVFFSLYSIIDGMFVSRLIGPNALSAVNIVYPIISILIGISVMFATGGNAIVGKLMGEEKIKEAREAFTLIILTTVAISLGIAFISLLFLDNIIIFLGSTEVLHTYCRNYLSIMVIFSPFLLLKLMFDYFFVTAGKATLGLICSILGGVTNIILDYVFIVNFNLGVSGAAIATIIGYAIPAIIGIIYFSNKKNILHFIKPTFNLKIILNCASNGSSEMVTQLSTAVTTFLYNIVMIKLLGEDGVAAITIVLYAQFLLTSAYLGFTSGVSPRISYNYGAKDTNELHKIIKYSLIFIGGFSIITFIFSKISAQTIIALFSGKGSALYDITLEGFNIFALSFLICGLNIFASGMFTAFSNGKISALLSMLRTFVFFILGFIILPKLLGVTGVWLIVPFAETLSLIFSLLYIFKYKHTYGYSKNTAVLS